MIGVISVKSDLSPYISFTLATGRPLELEISITPESNFPPLDSRTAKTSTLSLDIDIDIGELNFHYSYII